MKTELKRFSGANHRVTHAYFVVCLVSHSNGAKLLLLYLFVIIIYSKFSHYFDFLALVILYIFFNKYFVGQ